MSSVRPAYQGSAAWPEHAPSGFGVSESSSAEAKKVAELFSSAGIEIGGNQPWDLRVHDPRFYRRVLAGGSLAVGESYMDGWWDADALDEMFCRVSRADLSSRVRDWKTIGLMLKSRVFNCQSKSRSPVVVEQHYDLGNDIFQAMLDPWMQYSCGYWKDATTLEQAQENKLRLIGQKLKVEPGMTVLDIGGGFGGLARFLATQCGCKVAVYNISREQVAYGREWCKDLPVRFEQQDYREAVHKRERFDRVVSVGAFEHIGHKNYREFFELALGQLKEGGLFLLHTIGGNASYTHTDPWLDKYIFPNGVIPSVKQLGEAMERLWVMEDWHNFGPDYGKTLMAWWQRFEHAWPALEPKYGERFYRMWKYYLMGCGAAFRERQIQLWQIVLSKGDIPSYVPVR